MAGFMLQASGFRDGHGAQINGRNKSFTVGYPAIPGKRKGKLIMRLHRFPDNYSRASGEPPGVEKYSRMLH
jgi:hypothetical protein